MSGQANNQTPAGKSGSSSAIGTTATAKSSATKKRKLTPEEATFNAKLKDQSSLRFISAKVCEIVESKVTTTYNEVANELVIEALKLFDIGSHPEKKKKDHEKNIRRRVYDALNVLLATDIISKTKEKGDREKSIHWKGYPTTTSVDLIMLEKEKEAALAEIEKKKECLQELLVQNVCFRNLERRNKRMKIEDFQTEHDSGDEKIPLPFIVVNTSESAVIQCEMNQDKTDVMFDFSKPFEINDDNEILKRLGLSKAPYEELQKILPPNILRYCQEHHLLDAVLLPPNYYAYGRDPNVPNAPPPSSGSGYPYQHSAQQPPPHAHPVSHPYTQPRY